MGSEALDCLVLICQGVGGLALRRCWYLERLWIYCRGRRRGLAALALAQRQLLVWSLGRRRAELKCLDAATCIPCHWTLFFFRPSSGKESSFVEKMKKTVSFLSVLFSVSLGLVDA